MTQKIKLQALSLDRVTEGTEQAAKSITAKSERETVMELNILAMLFEELNEKVAFLESSRRRLSNPDWIALYKEVYSSFLIIEKAIYKRRILLSAKALQSLKGSVFALFEKYNSLSEIVSDAEQRVKLKFQTDESSSILGRVSYSGDIGKELENARERVRKLLDSVEPREQRQQ